MSEKFYVVAESELERLHSVAFGEGVVFCGQQNEEVGTYDYERFESDDTSDLAMAACRARPVPEWATHFINTLETPRLGNMFIQQCEEIKR